MVVIIRKVNESIQSFRKVGFFFIFKTHLPWGEISANDPKLRARPIQSKPWLTESSVEMLLIHIGEIKLNTAMMNMGN